MATISTRDPIQGSPFANVFSVSDGSNLKVLKNLLNFLIVRKLINYNKNTLTCISLLSEINSFFLQEASGIPYFYLTKLEMSVKDLNVSYNPETTYDVNLNQSNIFKIRNKDMCCVTAVNSHNVQLSPLTNSSYF